MQMTCKYRFVFVPQEKGECVFFFFLTEDVIVYDKVYYPLEEKGKKGMSML